MNRRDPLARTIPQRAHALWLGCALLYVFLSAVDVYLTWLLVDRGDLAYEANPLAAGVLEHYGWLGVGVFKLACVALVLGVGLWLWQRRPRTGRLLVGLGCLSSLVVVAYTMWLIHSADLLNSGWRLAEAELQSQALQRLQRKQLAYRDQVDVLVNELVHGRRTLVEASAELGAFLRQIGHDPFCYLTRYYPNLDDEACLAAHLVRQVGFQVAGNPERARAHLRALARQFAAYQAPLPPLSAESFAAVKIARGRRAALP